MNVVNRSARIAQHLDLKDSSNVMRHLKRQIHKKNRKALKKYIASVDDYEEFDYHYDRVLTGWDVS